MNFFIGFLITIIIVLCIYIFNKTIPEQKKKEEEEQLLLNKKEALEKEIDRLHNKFATLTLSLNQERANYDLNVEKQKIELDKQLELYKQNIDYAKEQYANTLEKNYKNIENKYDREIKTREEELSNAEAELKDIKSSLSAAAEAQLREREKEEKLDFYKLQVSSTDLEDIVKLNSFKLSLHNPVVISKLIWNLYFQKQTTEMCNRILGKEKICGIYKITNIKTKQCYIGQSVDIGQRWKDHCKCGLGIDASSTNKFYNAMQKDGIWNFTFELIEKCARNELDKKEKQWIEMYQANIYGYNGNKGNK